MNPTKYLLGPMPRAMDTERKILQKNPGKLDWNQFSVKAKGF